jgi:rhodanese-related sulfurtransferase
MNERMNQSQTHPSSCFDLPLFQQSDTLFIMKRMVVLAPLLLIFLASSSAQEIELTAVTFKELIDAGALSAIIDVRTATEFAQDGHIANATLVESLASFGSSEQVTTPTALNGCEDCDLAVDCRSGSRAKAAIQHLLTAGFRGRLYNGLGVNQWTAAGYPLVMDSNFSTPALCATTAEGAETCRLGYAARTSTAGGTSNNSSTTTTTTTTTTAAPVMIMAPSPPVMAPMAAASSAGTAKPSGFFLSSSSLLSSLLLLLHLLGAVVVIMY